MGKRNSFRALIVAVAAALLAPLAAQANTTTLNVNKTGFSLNGQAVVPIISWQQCENTLSQNLKLGVNLFANTCDAVGMDHALAGTGAYQIASIHNPEAGALPSVVGFIQDDEPDNWGEMPASLPDLSVAQGKPVFLNTTAHFANEMGDISSTVNHAIYPSYWAKADVVGFDLYPLAEFCNETQWVHYDDVYNFQRELTQADGSKPTFQWIEMNQLDMRCGPHPQTPLQVSNEIMQAVAGGASALGYFTWGPVGDGTWDSWIVAPDIAAQVAQTSKTLQQLASVIESPVGDWNLLLGYASSPVKVGIRMYDGHYWLIAVNSSDQTVKAAFGVKGAGTGSATVWNESRNVSMRNGSLADQFAPYATHVYELNPGTAKTTAAHPKVTKPKHGKRG